MLMGVVIYGAFMAAVASTTGQWFYHKHRRDTLNSHMHEEESRLAAYLGYISSSGELIYVQHDCSHMYLHVCVYIRHVQVRMA
jgi:hypothetical protein